MTSGIHYVPAEGPAIAAPQDGLDLIGEAWGANATTVVVPVERFDPAFFDLSSGLLGEVTQKFVNYRIRLVVLGEVEEYAVVSKPFRDYVHETNSGDHVWFVADETELGLRLAVTA